MNILLASSEVVPFAKTGGLADVCGALPGEIQKLGHQVTVFMPAFRSIYQANTEIDIDRTFDWKFRLGTESSRERCWRANCREPM